MSTTPVTESKGYQKAIAWIKAGPKKLLIGGNWVDARSGKTFETLNPATEERLADLAQAEAADVDAAVAAARKAFESPTWNGISPHARTRALLKIADVIEANAEELAVIETLDNGMPLKSAHARVAGAVEVFRYYAGWPSKIFGRTDPWESTGFLYVLREPMGVCGQINAWNVPVPTAAMKIGTALACGNTVVFKPAEQASLSTVRLAELITESGLPPGVVNIVTGFGAGAGAALSSHPGVDKVAFTGSTVTGKQILHASADNLKKVTLELGGKSPNIIFPDADLAKAIAAAANSFCGNSGQICSAGTRLFVHESIQDEVTEKVAKIAAGYKVGSPFDADTHMGPLISGVQMDRVLSYVGHGKDGGAKLELGGGRVRSPGYFVEPTVFSGVRNDMKIAREEIFGPVLSIIPFKDEADAVFQGNDTTFGLAAAVWTRDVSRAHKVARALKAGRVWINTYGQSGPIMSFGGYKQSGYGREQGAESIEAYTQTKSVFVSL